MARELRTQIAFLRAVNVGGRKLEMAALRAMLEALGFADVRTILQTGTALFRGGTKTGAALEEYLETELERHLHLRTDCFVRAATEWNGIIAGNPFPREAQEDPSHLVLMVLKSAPVSSIVAELQSAVEGRETVRATGRAVYIYYPDGIGESKLTTALLERKLKTRGTGRNWNTAIKIQAAAAG
ncbi:MAG: DUF1697 domain-containing protein [Terriglobia bacterium]